MYKIEGDTIYILSIFHGAREFKEDLLKKTLDLWLKDDVPDTKIHMLLKTA
jgi:hypothetical protein